MTAAVTFAACIPRGSAEWAQPLDFVLAEGTWQVVRTTPARSEPMLRLIVGLQDPSAGTVDVLGERPSDLPNRLLGTFRRRVGTALQPDGLIGNLTVRMNIIIPLVFSGICKADEAEQITDRRLEEFGLADYASARPPDLPPDIRQIAAVARAASRKPQVLLLEDPLSAVKSRQAAQVLAVCRRLAPTALVTTFRRNEPLYEAADTIALWDSRGFLPAEEQG